MAQKRMIDKKISVSEKVSNLPVEAQLLFTWMIPHSDDMGLLPFSAKTIKFLIIPMVEKVTVRDTGFHLETIRKEGLLRKVTINKEVFWLIVNFRDHQTLKRDRNPQLYAKIKLGKDIKSNWEMIDKAIDDLLETNGIQLELELKGTELNRREENRTENNINNTNKEYLKNIKEKHPIKTL